MSTIANDENDKEVNSRDVQLGQAHPGLLFCPECKERVHFVRQGKSERYAFVRTAHFRHDKHSTCVVAIRERRLAESDQHIAMKRVWAKAYPILGTEFSLPSGREADLLVALPDGQSISVECQVSPIDTKTTSVLVRHKSKPVMLSNARHLYQTRLKRTFHRDSSRAR